MSTWKDGLRNDDPQVDHWVRAAFANSGFRGLLAYPWKTDPDNLAAVNRWDRPHEVQDYLELYGSDVNDFLLFDDTSYRFDDVLGKKRHVKTCSENGLLFKHMQKAKSIMGNWKKKNA